MGRASSYLLATTYISLISSAGRKIYTRLNLISMLFTLVKASLEWADKPKENLEEIEKELKKLRRAYEFSLETSDYAFEKRSVFEAKMEEVLLKITLLVEKFDLLDASIVQEVYATRWRG
jgi:hypothetical protein